MPTVRMTSEDRVFLVDFSRFTLGEAAVLQNQLGVDVAGLGDRLATQDLEAIGAAMWLVELRRIAAEQGTTTRRAAEACPYEEFADSLDLVSLTTEVVEDPKGPAPATPTTRTRRTGSNGRQRRGSGADTSGSEPSPST